MPFQLCPHQFQPAGVGTCKVDQRHDTADSLSDSGRHSCAGESPMEHNDEQEIQHHIRHACRQDHIQSQMRFFGGDKKALKHILEHKHRQRENQDPGVQHAVFQHLAPCAHHRCNGSNEEKAHQRRRKSDDNCRIDHHGKIPVRPFGIALAAGLCHQSAAAGTQHKANRTHRHQQRHNQIYRRKRRFSHVIGNEKSVHHAINRSEDHHYDRRKNKPQQFSYGKMI